jgi:hypothetical protein
MMIWTVAFPGVQLSLLGRPDLRLRGITTRHPYYLWRVDMGKICSLEDDTQGQIAPYSRAKMYSIVREE